jgi:hypothetical protein
MVFLNKAEATVDLPVDPETEAESAATTTNETPTDTSSTASPDQSTATESSETASSTEAGQETTSSSAGDTAEETEGSADSGNDTKDKTAEKEKTKKSKSSKKEKKPSVPKKEKETVLRRVLTVFENHQLLSPTRWSTPEIAVATSRLRALDHEDNRRRAKEAGLNELEGYPDNFEYVFSDCCGPQRLIFLY